jgi:putative AdoMet-dependent methyltransferase
MSDSRLELFNRWAENYDDSTRHSEVFPFAGRDQVLNRVVSLAEARSSMQVLDLGTGTGDLAARFAHLNCAVWGLDFSASMLAVARRKVPEASFVQADLRSHLPLELPRRFDRIVSTYVLHEFTLSEKVNLLYTLLHAHVSDGGRIVIGDVAFLSAEDREAAHRKWTDLWDEHEHYWAADETIAACTKHRLRIRYEQVSICGGVFEVRDVS